MMTRLCAIATGAVAFSLIMVGAVVEAISDHSAADSKRNVVNADTGQVDSNNLADLVVLERFSRLINPNRQLISAPKEQFTALPVNLLPSSLARRRVGELVPHFESQSLGELRLSLIKIFEQRSMTDEWADVAANVHAILFVAARRQRLPVVPEEVIVGDIRLEFAGKTVEALVNLVDQGGKRTRNIVLNSLACAFFYPVHEINVEEVSRDCLK